MRDAKIRRKVTAEERWKENRDLMKDLEKRRLWNDPSFSRSFAARAGRVCFYSSREIEQERRERLHAGRATGKLQENCRKLEQRGEQIFA